jgi:hypothetical protein
MISSFERLLQRARADANVLGVILSGSRGRGTARPESDWDCYVIVGQDDPGLAADLPPDVHHVGLDATVLTLAAFELYAAPGTRNAWEAYAFAHAAIEHDRLGGRIAELAAAKEYLPVEVADRLARVSLDRYLNAAVEARSVGGTVSETQRYSTPRRASRPRWKRSSRSTSAFLPTTGTSSTRSRRTLSGSTFRRPRRCRASPPQPRRDTRTRRRPCSHSWSERRVTRASAT